MDNAPLIKRCQLGDISSFNELYKIYSKNALGTAYLIAGQKTLAEDIVHEAFIQCFQSIKSLKNVETFDVWFYKIVTRTGWRMINKNKSDISLDEIETENCLYISSHKDEINNNETKLLLYEALDKLSIPLRTVIVLHYYNDMTIKDIAKILGCFEGTVKSRLHNARKQLKQILGESLEEDSTLLGYM
jgi:RNA polymerase sigma-70 factor (ECF subfamily)